MNALDLLTADHNRIRGLFSRFQEAKAAKRHEEMSNLATRILCELEVHTAIEEEVFYPAVDTLGGDFIPQIAEGLEEHHVADALAIELQNLSPDTEAWVAKVTVLIENVEHHVKEEETEMFPSVRSAMKADQLEALAKTMEDLKVDLGAPTTADKDHLSLEDLHALATEQQIPGRSSMNREELMATVGIG